MACFFCGRSGKVVPLLHRNADGAGVGAVSCCASCIPPAGLVLKAFWPGEPTESAEVSRLNLMLDEAYGLLDEANGQLGSKRGGWGDLSARITKFLNKLRPFDDPDDSDLAILKNRDA